MRKAPHTLAAAEALVEDVGMMRAANETRKGDWMECWPGVKFYPLDPRSEEVRLDTIAHSLARINRYNGQTEVECYTVAEHSVLMALALLSEGCPPAVAYQALFHDAPEAYIGDMVRPLKRNMPDFVAAEDPVWRAVVDAFPILSSFKEAAGYEMDRRVKEADNRILVDERAQVMRPSGLPWGIDHLPPLNVSIAGWYPAEAERRFLNAEELLRGMCEAA